MGDLTRSSPRVSSGRFEQAFRPGLDKRRFGADSSPPTGDEPGDEPGYEDEIMDEKTRTELEAAAFRRLVDHLRDNADVQNIDLMNLAGFCRNCLSKWYRAAAEERGLDMDDDQAREIIYGMPYAEWKTKYQREATPEQKAAFAKTAESQGRH